VFARIVLYLEQLSGADCASEIQVRGSSCHCGQDNSTGSKDRLVAHWLHDLGTEAPKPLVAKNYVVADMQNDRGESVAVAQREDTTDEQRMIAFVCPLQTHSASRPAPTTRTEWRA
jgi:hypothetical protein